MCPQSELARDGNCGLSLEAGSATVHHEWSFVLWQHTVQQLTWNECTFAELYLPKGYWRWHCEPRDRWDKNPYIHCTAYVVINGEYKMESNVIALNVVAQSSLPIYWLHQEPLNCKPSAKFSYLPNLTFTGRHLAMAKLHSMLCLQRSNYHCIILERISVLNSQFLFRIFHQFSFFYIDAFVRMCVIYLVYFGKFMWLQ